MQKCTNEIMTDACRVTYGQMLSLREYSGHVMRHMVFRKVKNVNNRPT